LSLDAKVAVARRLNARVKDIFEAEPLAVEPQSAEAA